MVKANSMVRRYQNQAELSAFTFVHNADNRRLLRLAASCAKFMAACPQSIRVVRRQFLTDQYFHNASFLFLSQYCYLHLIDYITSRHNTFGHYHLNDDKPSPFDFHVKSLTDFVKLYLSGLRVWLHSNRREYRKGLC